MTYLRFCWFCLVFLFTRKPKPPALTTDKDPYGDSLSFKRAIEDAASKGCSIRYPKANELFVDLDTSADFVLFNSQLAKLRDYLDVAKVEIAPSKSGLPKRHAVVTLLRPVTPSARIALQAILGSDRVRELLSWARMNAGNPQPTLFFERK